jgi:hypothetical protein
MAARTSEQWEQTNDSGFEIDNAPEDLTDEQLDALVRGDSTETLFVKKCR